MQFGVETDKAVSGGACSISTRKRSPMRRCSSCFMTRSRPTSWPRLKRPMPRASTDSPQMLLSVTLLKNSGLDLIGELTGKFEGVRILIVTDTSDEVSALEHVKAADWHCGHTADVEWRGQEGQHHLGPR